MATLATEGQSLFIEYIFSYDLSSSSSTAALVQGRGIAEGQSRGQGRALAAETGAGLALLTPSPPETTRGGGVVAARGRRMDRKRDAHVLAASLLSTEPPRLGKMSGPLAAGPGAVPPRKSVPVPSHQTRGRVVLQLRMR